MSGQRFLPDFRPMRSFLGSLLVFGSGVRIVGLLAANGWLPMWLRFLAMPFVSPPLAVGLIACLLLA